MNKDLFDFIKASPTAFHAVAEIKKELKLNGFCELMPQGEWSLEKGKGYFVSRNGSSLIAFKVPEESVSGLMIGAVHSDSPCLKIKENAQLRDSYFVRLSCEKYGSMINSTWLDRPLSVAGRVIVRTEKGIESKLADLKKPVAIIPNVAIHLNRNANENSTLNPAVDMLPLYTLAENENSLISQVAKSINVAEEDIVSFDLMLYNPENGTQWGDFVSAPRLDDLQCVFSALKGFLSCGKADSMPVLAVFDNEEVGSSTKQGADSDFLFNVLKKAANSLGKTENEFFDILSQSFMLSCDNAHSVHPNHPELSDKNHEVVINGGIVIKHNANQRYCTDAVSSALVKILCDRKGIPTQNYANRADIAGGSTLGNIANTQLSLITADIGLAQLAMHSSFETAGSKDTEYMVELLKEFFSSSLTVKSDGEYEI